MPCAPCVVGLLVDKEAFYFEEEYVDEETGENTWEKRTPAQQRDNDSQRAVLACFCGPCQLARLYREVILRGMKMPSLGLEPMKKRTLSGGMKKGLSQLLLLADDEEHENKNHQQEEEFHSVVVVPVADDDENTGNRVVAPQVKEMGRERKYDDVDEEDEKKNDETKKPANEENDEHQKNSNFELQMTNAKQEEEKSDTGVDDEQKQEPNGIVHHDAINDDNDDVKDECEGDYVEKSRDDDDRTSAADGDDHVFTQHKPTASTVMSDRTKYASM